MSEPEHIDRILRSWPYEPGQVLARQAKGDDGRPVLQMRLEMGLLQMEVEGRPDGERPAGKDTYYDYLVDLVARDKNNYQFSQENCFEADREFVQFYHRRVCWLALKQFDRAVADADHTLALMDLTTAHAPDQDWALSHEQYRPFVIFHRIQAAALAHIDSNENAQGAVEEIDAGLQQLQELFDKWETDEPFEDNELVRRLHELRKSLSDYYSIEPTLSEQLANAVAAEEYERAARIRDEMRRRGETAS